MEEKLIIYKQNRNRIVFSHSEENNSMGIVLKKYIESLEKNYSGFIEICDIIIEETVDDIDLDHIVFKNCVFTGSLFKNISINDCSFINCDLNNMNFYYVKITNTLINYVSFKNSILYNVLFNNSSMHDVDFFNSDLRSCVFENIKKTVGVRFLDIICPSEGSFIGYKKAYSINKANAEKIIRIPYIIKLEIPADAKRSSATTYKCRCSKAKVLAIENLDGTKADLDEVYSGYDNSFKYKVGEIVEVDDFDEDRWNECSRGIHFFMNREQTVDY